jgi:hypothetical protein
MAGQLPPSAQLMVNLSAMFVAVSLSVMSIISVVAIWDPDYRNRVDRFVGSVKNGMSVGATRSIEEVGRLAALFIVNFQGYLGFVKERMSFRAIKSIEEVSHFAALFIVIFLEAYLVPELRERGYGVRPVLSVVVATIVLYVFSLFMLKKRLSLMQSCDRIDGSWGSLIKEHGVPHAVSTFNIQQDEDGIIIEGVSFKIVAATPTLQLEKEDKWWSSDAAYSNSKLLFHFTSNHLGSGLCIYKFGRKHPNLAPAWYDGSFHEEISRKHFVVEGRRIGGQQDLIDHERLKQLAIETFQKLGNGGMPPAGKR